VGSVGVGLGAGSTGDGAGSTGDGAGVDTEGAGDPPPLPPKQPVIIKDAIETISNFFIKPP
jgi:hypothetical protein